MGKYLHLYETTSDFETDYSGTAYTEPWVSFTEQSGGVNYNKRFEWDLVFDFSEWGQGENSSLLAVSSTTRAGVSTQAAAAPGQTGGWYYYPVTGGTMFTTDYTGPLNVKLINIPQYLRHYFEPDSDTADVTLTYDSNDIWQVGEEGYWSLKFYNEENTAAWGHCIRFIFHEAV